MKEIWANVRTLPYVIRQIVNTYTSYVPKFPSLTFYYSSASFNSCTSYHMVTHHLLTHPSAWIAWFPVLFYSTIYIGDLHKWSSPVATNDDERAALDAEATRLGSRALFYSALLALLVNLTLPFFVAEATPGGGPGSASTKYNSTWWERMCRVPTSMQVHLATIWAVSHLVFAGCMFATL